MECQHQGWCMAGGACVRGQPQPQQPQAFPHTEQRVEGRGDLRLPQERVSGA